MHEIEALVGSRVLMDGLGYSSPESPEGSRRWVEPWCGAKAEVLHACERRIDLGIPGGDVEVPALLTDTCHERTRVRANARSDVAQLLGHEQEARHSSLFVRISELLEGPWRRNRDRAVGLGATWLAFGPQPAVAAGRQEGVCPCDPSDCSTPSPPVGFCWWASSSCSPTAWCRSGRCSTTTGTPSQRTHRFVSSRTSRRSSSIRISSRRATVECTDRSF